MSSTIVRFLNILGMSITKRLLLTAAKISSIELRGVGFFDQIINDGENVIEKAHRFIEQCKELSSEAMGGMKLSINDIIMNTVDKETIDLRIEKALKSQYLERRLKLIKEKNS